MIRIETARILRYMLANDVPLTNSTLANELDLPINNVHKRTKRMFNQRLIGRELRYLPSSVGRTEIFYLWASTHGKESLGKYEARQLKRPSVFKIKKPVVAPNVVFEPKPRRPLPEQITDAERIRRTATAPTQNWNVGIYAGMHMVPPRGETTYVPSRGISA